MSGPARGGGVTKAALDLVESNAAPLVADRDRLAPGRQWSTRFDNADLDAALFDTINFTRTTDSGRSALVQTATGSPSLVTLKGQQLRNVDVLLRYRYVSDATYTLAFLGICPFARWVAPASGTDLAAQTRNCMMAVDDRWGIGGLSATGAPWLGVQSRAAGVEGTRAATAGAAPTMSGSDVTKHRYLRLRVVDDVLYCRNWFADVTEPDTWGVIARSRSASLANPGGLGQNLTADDMIAGAAGFLAQFTASLFYELTITELVSRTTNGVTNPTFREDENTAVAGAGLPHSWYTLPLHANSSVSKPSIADRKGRVRPALRLVVASPGTASGQLWFQRIWNTLCPGASAAWPRMSPFPRTALAALMEVRVWSRGTGIVNPSPSALFGGLGLAAGIDNYYTDVLGAQANLSLPDYFTYLGPNVGGIGTWDWYETVFVMPVNRHQAISYLDLGLGLHDASASGTLEIMDPILRPVAA